MLLSDAFLSMLAIVAFSAIASREYGALFSCFLALGGIALFCSFFLVSYGIASFIQ